MRSLERVGILIVLVFVTSMPACAQAQDNSSANNAQSTDTSGNDDASSGGKSWIDEKFGGLNLTAGPSSSGGFGAALKGEGRRSWLTDSGNGDGCHLPVSPYLGYVTDDSWNTKAGSMNQASIDLRPGLDAGVFCGKWNFVPPSQISEECRTNPRTGCPLPGHPTLVANFGAYGDLRYRYGTFEVGAKPTNINQLLGGGGVYAVWPIIGQDQSWIGIDIWPRVSLTYYAPIASNSSLAPIALPAGIKANFLQAEFKTALNLGPQGSLGAKNYPFRLTITYDGSQPTTGTDKVWENLWNLQLSTDILGTTFKPAVTYQSGRNGGLQYDRQVLIGIVTDLL